MEDLVRTRIALHAVAELLLAGPQFRTSGRIRLAVTPGGFSTVEAPDVRVEGTDVLAGDHRRPIAGTARELGAALGLHAGRPEGLYADGVGVGLDAALTIDADAARRITDAFNLGVAALRQLAPDARPVLWSEHFDVAIRVDDVNYGVSPGDGFLPEPYAYVGTHPVPDGPFWNAPFGAVRRIAEFTETPALADFFAAGRAEIASG